MDHDRATSSATALALAIGLAALVLSVAEAAVRYVPHTWIQRDGRFYTNVNVSLVEEGSLEQDEFAISWYSGTLGWNRNLDQAWSNLARGREGRLYPKHPVLMPILATPLFWAFGLPGTLIFNVLLFAVIGGAGFAAGRRYGSFAGATFAALALPLATGVRDHVYDYHVDVLLLALFTLGLALALARRGLLAGLVIGAAVATRPTMLIWLPSLVLLLVERRAWRELGWAMLGGAIPLVLYALANHVLFGAPWWSGYNRVLVVVDGVPQVHDHQDAFAVPLDEGLRTLWEGPWGVRTRLPLMFAAAPGLLLLLRTRPLYVLAAVLGVVLSVLVFAKYQWFGDRFLWPSCALLIPALVVSVDALGRLVRRRPEWRTPIGAAVATTLVLVAHVAVGPPIEVRLGGEGAWERLALALGTAGALSAALAHAAARVERSPLAMLAPVVFLLLPGVRERLLDPGLDVIFALLVVIAIGARHTIVTALAALGAGGALLFAAPGAGSEALLARLAEPEGRAAVLLFALAIPGVLALGPRAAMLLPLGLLVLGPVAGLGGARLPLFALALLSLPVLALAARLAAYVHDTLRYTGPARPSLAAASVLLALLVAGLVARAEDPPFRIASYRGVREAVVHLGRVPCDFLAWEHLNWECSSYDHGVHGETGLATSQPLTVGGHAPGLFLISTQRGMPRTVRWREVPAGGQFVLQYAVPDGMRGGGRLTVRVEGDELSAIRLPAAPDGRLHRATVDTARFRGRAVTLELELAGPGVVVLDGGFEG